MVYLDKDSLEQFLSKKTGKVAPKGVTPILDRELSTSSLSRSEQESTDTESINEATQIFARIERLVKIRDRSIKEIRERLLRDGANPHALENALSRACRCGYLDDMRFADVLIRTRLRAGKGLAGIARELKSHGIDIESIPGFPDDYLCGTQDQYDAAFALLCRKPPRAKNLQQAAYAKLIRAGYTSSIASDVTRKWYALRDKTNS